LTKFCFSSMKFFIMPIFLVNLSSSFCKVVDRSVCSFCIASNVVLRPSTLLLNKVNDSSSFSNISFKYSVDFTPFFNSCASIHISVNIWLICYSSWGRLEEEDDPSLGRAPFPWFHLIGKQIWLWIPWEFVKCMEFWVILIMQLYSSGQSWRVFRSRSVFIFYHFSKVSNSKLFFLFDLSQRTFQLKFNTKNSQS